MPSTPWGLSAGRTAVAALCALVVGGGIGAAVGHAGATSRTAQVQLALQQDPQVLDSSATSDLTTFLQTELVYLNSPALADEVRTRLALGQDPDLAAARVDQSAVVQLTATGATTAQAEAQVAAAAAAYVDRRTTSATQEIDEQLTSIQSQIADLQGQLASLSAIQTEGTSPGPQALALQSQLQNVLELQTTLDLSRQQAARGAVVIQDATVLPAGTPGWLLGAVAGAVLALLLLLGALLARMRFSDRLRSPQQLGRLHPKVVSTTLPAATSGVGGLADAAAPQLQRAVRLQASQVPALGDAPRSRAVVFVGASVRADVSFAAAQHAIALARRHPTVLVCADDAGQSSLADQFDVPRATPGLTDLVADLPRATEEVTRLLVDTPIRGLRVMTTGTSPEGMTALERVVREGILSELAGSGLRIVVAAPSLDLSAAAVDLARDAGSVVLVATLGRSSVSEVESTLDVLRGSGASVEAVLLTAHAKGGRPPAATASTRAGTTPTSAPGPTSEVGR